jgi:glycosyltransferase involved in cell wall biosynthesis
MSKPLAVISAPVDIYSGYSSRSRDFIKALWDQKSEVWDIKILPQRWGNLPFGYIADHQEEWGWLQPLILTSPDLPSRPDYWFQITVPNEFKPVGKWNCGVTAGIETDLCDISWVEGCNRMDLVIVSSEHAKKVFETTKAEVVNDKNERVRLIELTAKVEVLFEGVDTAKFFSISADKFKTAPIKDLPVVSDLNLIKESFCFLFVGHWLPGILGHDRKNVGYLVKSFLEIFKNRRQKPALILKVVGPSTSITDRYDIEKKLHSIISSVTGDIPQIYLLYGDVSESDMNLLYNHPKVKAMVSLTKGEGFGRPLLEFTQSKKPILVSGWSGHIDFLDPKFTFQLSGSLENVHPSAQVPNVLIPEAQWFKPDPIQVATLFVELYENYAKYVDLGKRQAYRSSSQFSLKVMKEKLGGLLAEHAPDYKPFTMPDLTNLYIPAPKSIPDATFDDGGIMNVLSTVINK